MTLRIDRGDVVIQDVLYTSARRIGPILQSIRNWSKINGDGTTTLILQSCILNEVHRNERQWCGSEQTNAQRIPLGPKIFMAKALMICKKSKERFSDDAP